jgi:hypothetical protein
MKTKQQFDNSERLRYYGLRIGDIIKCDAYGITEAEVVNYGFFDNNSVIVKEKGKEPRKVVAEWCDIITRVENR